MYARIPVGNRVRLHTNCRALILLFKPLELCAELTEGKQSLVVPIVHRNRNLDSPPGGDGWRITTR
jgi:hypothetical protein